MQTLGYKCGKVLFQSNSANDCAIFRHKSFSLVMQPLFEIWYLNRDATYSNFWLCFCVQVSVVLDTQVFLPAPFSWNRTTNWQHKTSYGTGGIKATPVLICSWAHSELLLIVLRVTWTSSLIWVQSVPGFPGSLALGCLSNTASLCWTAAHWTSQGPHVHKGMFGWIRYIATHTPLVCLFDSTNVIWHLNWVREVPVSRWTGIRPGNSSIILVLRRPLRLLETENVHGGGAFQQFLQTKASHFISFL